MGLSWPHILIVVLLFILLFGRGKISDLMGDVAKGIKSFKQGLAEEPEAEAEPEPEVIPPAPKTIEHKQAAPATRTRSAAPAKPKTTASKTAPKTASKTTSRRKTSTSKTSASKATTTRTRNSG